MDNWTIVTREQLYELVWQKPVLQVALHFGISNVGLAKLCTRHQIPVPPRGYWALLDVGKAPKKVSLPAVANARPITIRRTITHTLSSEDESAVRAEKSGANRIVVGDKLRATHPVVRAAKEALQAVEPDEIGILRPTECHAIRVSRAQRSRALLVFEALVKAFEDRTWPVTLEGGKAHVRSGDVSILIMVTEETKYVERQSKPDFSGGYSFHFQRHDRVDKPCGRLAVEIEEESRLLSCHRRRWHDTEKHVLEDQLNDVLIGVLKLADAVREYLARQRREEQQARERERRIDDLLAEQGRLRKLLAKERADVGRLRDQAARWKESEVIRGYVAQVRSQGRLQEDGLEGEAADAWCSWALQQADRLDPFAESPPSILDQADQIEHMSDGIPGWRLR